jgi:glycerophosphoryl diester phosphodiesterase
MPPSPPRTRIASHRGGAILWPENSVTAFRASAALAVEQVELDVHLSADDAVVVIHDATLDRTTEARGPVRARSLAELRQVRLKGAAGETVPTLAEVAAILAPTQIGLRVELKADAEGRCYPGLLSRTLAVLAGAGMAGRVAVTSFQAGLAAEAVGLVEEVIWLVSPPVMRDIGLAGAIAAAQAQGVGGIGLHESLCDAVAVAEVRQAGLVPGAWAVNGESTIRRVLALGVAVFTTDDPVTALRLRG